MRKKFFSLLVLLAAVVTSAMAQEESLLTTLTFGGSETYGETTSGVVTVTATNVSLYNGTFGWLLAEESSLSVTAKEGYTITKCVFRQNAKTPITDTEAPFEIHTNDWGGIIEDPYEEMNGVTSIEVYGYANAGGGSAATEVIITQDDFPKFVTSFTKDGVTVSAGDIDSFDGNLSEGGSFSTTLGNFTQIEVNAANVNISGTGWSGDSKKMTWTGNASSVSFSGDINGYGKGTTLKFTIEPASTPEPAGEVTVVFAANDKTVEKTVTLPHDFSCSYSDKDGELDAIIKELYEISAGHCSDDNYPVASGNEAVVAGSNGFDNYITISAAFEGTATVSGSYWNSDAYDGDGDWMNYSLTISIKGDEPEPEPAGDEITVTWNSYDLPSSGSSFTKDGVTLTCTIDDDLYGPGTFTTNLGNFTQIVVSGEEACYIDATGGWSGNTDQKTWTGNAASVSWGGSIYSFSSDVTIVFTIEPSGTATAVENVQTNHVQAIKFFRDGMLLIEKNGKIYNVQGTIVR